MAVIKLWPFRRSEHDQFEVLLRPHLEQLYKLAYRFTQQHDEAEDLVQDVLLKLYPKLHIIQKIDKLSPWLARVLYRQFVDKHRRQKRSPVEFTDDEQSLYEVQSRTGITAAEPHEIFESGARQDQLQHALAQLNDDQRILVLLHDVEGYTLEEIHQIQTVSIGTLKSRLSRARSKLRDILNQREPFAGTSRVRD